MPARDGKGDRLRADGHALARTAGERARLLDERRGAEERGEDGVGELVHRLHDEKGAERLVLARLVEIEGALHLRRLGGAAGDPLRGGGGGEFEAGEAQGALLVHREGEGPFAVFEEGASEVAEERPAIHRRRLAAFDGPLEGAQPLEAVALLLREDGEAHRFNKAGEALDVSHVQMAQYLAAADYALREVLADRISRPESATFRTHTRDNSHFARKMKYNEFNR
ncbi:MAG: DUF1587 domain-containing protein, partial [Planctomycetes bacterium]|nr:DUF1587 domain-containing protein [Planctomycetota bacterium]